MNNNLYNLYTNKLNECFFDSFKEAYESIKKRGKTKVLNYTECIYKRWYYSTFFEETILSPCNLQYRLGNKLFNEPQIEAPIFKPISTKYFRGFNISLENYNNYNHPIVKDLKIFLESCTPEISVDENGMLLNKDYIKVIDKMTIFDPFYLQYLLILSVKLKLVDKLPSIYSSMFHITKKRIDFFKRNNNEILNDIVYAAIDITIDNLDNYFPMTQGLFNRELIIKLITSPVPIDDIFRKIYYCSGIEIEEIWNLELEEIDDMDNIILSSTYFMGILFDKWFLTPFGHYFRFIQPIYILPYRIKDEVEALCNGLENNEYGEFISMLYAPCSRYFTTTLGLDFFKIFQRGKIKGDFKELSVECIIDLVLDDIKNNTYNSLKKLKTHVAKIYQMKIKDMNDKKYWKVLEIQDNKTLHFLFFEICKMFAIEPYYSYSIFLDEDCNPFNEYTSPDKTRRTSKKTNKTILSDLEFKKEQKFIFKINCNQKLNVSKGSDSIFLLEVEILDIGERLHGKVYPRIIRKSKLAKEIDNSF